MTIHPVAQSNPRAVLPVGQIFSDAAHGDQSGLPYRDVMESAFGQDFSGVRVSLGRRDAMDSFNARAATFGEHIVFADSSPDKTLIAHETAHIAQQRLSIGSQLKSQISSTEDAAEREADSVASRASAGKPVAVTAVPTAAVHRDIKDKNLKVPLGNFEIDMTKSEVVGGKTGEVGSISFTPNDKAPDSKSIRLSQAVKTFDVSTGADADYSKVGGGTEANRNKMQTAAGAKTHATLKGETLKSVAGQHYGDPSRFGEVFDANKPALAATMTAVDGDKVLPEKLSLTIPKAVGGGFFIDHMAGDPKAKVRTAKGDPEVPQDYVWPGEEVKNKNQHGSKAGKTVVPAILDDKPRTTGHIQFTFETIARSQDDGTHYGTVNWSFDADGTKGKVTNETHGVMPGVSDTYREALGEFNKFYKNPPVGP
jgi:hypothetical protein